MIAASTCAASCVAMDKCCQCARVLTHDEIALTKKLVNRGSRVFYCLSCLAVRFEASEEELREKIVYFKDMGCTLFEDAAQSD